MSASTGAGHLGARASAAGARAPEPQVDDRGVHAEPAHGSLAGYLTGFGLSVVLTAVPFWLVMDGVISDANLTAIAIMAFAAVQIVVHMVFFLHMNTKSEGGWNFLALVFTVVLVVIALAGSLWVMYHLNTNMMMMPAHDMHGMP